MIRNTKKIRLDLNKIAVKDHQENSTRSSHVSEKNKISPDHNLEIRVNRSLFGLVFIVPQRGVDTAEFTKDALLLLYSHPLQLHTPHDSGRANLGGSKIVRLFHWILLERKASSSKYNSFHCSVLLYSLVIAVNNCQVFTLLI
jgi:hypothetical protein